MYRIVIEIISAGISTGLYCRRYPVVDWSKKTGMIDNGSFFYYRQVRNQEIKRFPKFKTLTIKTGETVNRGRSADSFRWLDWLEIVGWTITQVSSISLCLYLARILKFSWFSRPYPPRVIDIYYIFIYTICLLLLVDWGGKIWRTLIFSRPTAFSFCGIFD